MPKVCVYLQLHQPFRLRDFSVFELGHGRGYFSEEEDGGNKKTFLKVAQKSYKPMLTLLLALTKRHPKFVFAISASGVFLEQAERYDYGVIELLQALINTGQVEILAETYYHSLASLYSETEFAEQVRAHQKKVHQLFGVTPTVFRNTELVYSNHIGAQVAALGYVGMLTEGVGRHLWGRPKTQVYWNVDKNLPLLLKHAELSDDLAFRFSDRNWQWYPLSLDKYLEWIEVYPEDQLVNLFMDFETFGEHQWADTGIFQFFEQFADRFLQKSWNHFVLPSEALTAAAAHPIEHIYDVPQPISWADVDRDLTAWIDNDFQRDTIQKIYKLESAVMASKNLDLIADWRKLQTSDHFYYMCTKWSADGDVHAYFSPYESPYEAYRRFSIVLADITERI